MKTLTILLIALLLGIWTGIVSAGQKYNAFENRWETTGPNESLKYNAFDNEWSYEPPGSQLEYNAFEDKFEYAPPSDGFSDPGYLIPNPWDN